MPSFVNVHCTYHEMWLGPALFQADLIFSLGCYRKLRFVRTKTFQFIVAEDKTMLKTARSSKRNRDREQAEKGEGGFAAPLPLSQPFKCVCFLFFALSYY